MALLPVVLREGGAFSYPGVRVSAPRLAVIMDYQNIHLTARDCYAPYGTPAEDVLVHPLLFAQRLVLVRAARQMDPRAAQS